MREVNKSEFCGFYSGLFAVPIIRAVKEDVLHTLDDGWQWMGIICRQINFSLTFVLATYKLPERPIET